MLLKLLIGELADSIVSDSGPPLTGPIADVSTEVSTLRGNILLAEAASMMNESSSIFHTM